MAGPDLAVVDGLIPANLKFDKAAGRSGLRALPGVDGIYVVAFNAKGERVRFNAKQRQWLTQTIGVLYPGSTVNGSLIGRNGERQRTVIGMKSRLEFINSRKQGDILGLESLDSRPIPANPSKLNPDNHREFSRAMTWVLMEPAPPRRYVAMSEFPIKIDGKNRFPDEVFVSYVLSQDEIDKVKDPNYKGFKSLGGVDANDLRVHIGDPNLEISEASARTHFKKTNQYMVAMLDKLVNEWKLTPRGSVSCSARDVYLHQDMVKLSDPKASGKHGASVVKTLDDIDPATGQRTGKKNSVLYLATTFESEVQPNQSMKWVAKPKPASVIGKPVIGKLENTAMKSFIENLADNDVIPKLLKILK